MTGRPIPVREEIRALRAYRLTPEDAPLLRAKLDVLSKLGVEGEAESATRKLENLLEKWDFDAPNPDGDDLFTSLASGHVRMQMGDKRDLKEKYQCADMAAFIKWSLLEAYGIDGRIRQNKDGSFTLTAECAAEHLKTLNHVAKILHAAFRELMVTFLALPGASSRDSRIFLRGIYDGMMNDPKKPGELLPKRSPVKMQLAKKKALAHAPGLAIHPYTTGMEMGARVRMSIPIEQIAGDLKDAEARARLTEPKSYEKPHQAKKTPRNRKDRAQGPLQDRHRERRRARG